MSLNRFQYGKVTLSQEDFRFSQGLIFLLQSLKVTSLSTLVSKKGNLNSYPVNKDSVSN